MLHCMASVPKHTQGFDLITAYTSTSAQLSCFRVFRSVLQLGFKGRGAPGRALFAKSYKNEGTMFHMMWLISRHVTKYNPIPQ